VCRAGEELGQVPVEDPHLHVAVTGDVREGQVAAGGHAPGNVDDPADLPKESDRLRSGVPLEVGA